ncbi:MAG: DMT family transporter [Rhodospirillales bacterium]|tara:strand:+ start:425 stop:1318 length:894 start_codon:yes stop_codon:yes gene_type:complete
MNNVILANCAAAVASLSAGASIVATRFVVGDLEPLSLAFYRYLVASICLIPILMWGFTRFKIKKYDIIPIISLGSLLYALFPWLFSLSLFYTSAAFGAIGLATLPIITLIVAFFFKRELLNTLKIMGVLLAFIGVVIAVSQSLDNSESNQNHILGIVLMVCAATVASIYSIFCKRYIMDYGPVFFSALSMLTGMLTLFPFVWLMRDLSIITSLDYYSWISLIFLGIIGGAFQFTAYTWALKWLTPTRATVYLTLNPISAIFIAYPVLGETITTSALIGLVCVLSAIFLVNYARKNNN